MSDMLPEVDRLRGVIGMYIEDLARAERERSAAEAHTREVYLELKDAERERDEAQHGLALIEPHTQRGVTDCSTPLHIRVQNIVAQLEQAERERDEALTDHALLCDHYHQLLLDVDEARKQRDEAHALLRDIHNWVDLYDMEWGIRARPDLVARLDAALGDKP